MPSCVIGGLSGAGQDELSWLLAVIYRAADVVPDRWGELPLIEQPWGLALEDQAGVDLSRFAHLIIDIEPSFASGNLPSSLGLSAGLGSLDQDSASVSKPLFQLWIGDSGAIGHV